MRALVPCYDKYVEHDEMDVQWVSTKRMLADGFT